MTTLRIPARYCGPANSGNGGWCSGAIADLRAPDSTDSVTVTLRRPPPLDRDLDVFEDNFRVVAEFDGETVLEAILAGGDPHPVPAVDAAAARRAEADYPGLVSHPFPTCFTCGTAREPGDGLRIFPGVVEPVGAHRRTAATWTPHESLAGPDGEAATVPVTWASLDCVSAWAADVGERLMVLGRMTAQLIARPVIGREHVVVGMEKGSDGRKHHTAASLYDDCGDLVGTAEHVWIEIDRSTIG